jgi:hypothetical protein
MSPPERKPPVTIGFLMTLWIAGFIGLVGFVAILNRGPSSSVIVHDGDLIVREVKAFRSREGHYPTDLDEIGSRLGPEAGMRIPLHDVTYYAQGHSFTLTIRDRREFLSGWAYDNATGKWELRQW